MANQLPTLLPLSDVNRFEAPIYQSHPRSPSSSPIRHGHFAAHELDPLLANLSPISTLEALRANDAVSPLAGSKERVLADSIAEASENERALGIRAALAGKKLREWVEEVEYWHWPREKFAPPLGANEGLRNGDNSLGSASNSSSERYAGSLPARVVREREARIESIREDMDTLELNELKSYVRGAHSQPSNHANSYNTSFGVFQPSQYTHLDDFTMIITATIVQSLPFLARLERLISRWSLRLSVLHQVPGFLQQLEDAQLALGSAWTTLREAAEDITTFEMTREAYLAIKAILQSNVSKLATQIDAILDVLEGQDDRIPDQWIDDMEEAETDFQNWIVEAERMVELNEWRARRSSKALSEHASKLDHDDSATGQESPAPLRNMKDVTERDFKSLPSDKVLVKETAIGGTYQTDASDDSADLRGSEGSPQGPIASPVGASNQANGKRTPSHGLFFMRGSPRSPANLEALTSDTHSEVSNQADEQVAHQSPLLVNSQGAQGDLESLQSESPNLSVRHSGHRKPPPLTLDQGIDVESAPISELSATASESSGASSDMSSPQIMDASSVQFFKTPMDDKFPTWATQDDSTPMPKIGQKTTHSTMGHARSVSAIDPLTRSRASSHVSDITIIGHEVDEGRKRDEDYYALPRAPGLAVHRASIASIEAIPRSELRNISIDKTAGQRPRAGSSSGPLSTEHNIAEQIAETQREIEAEQEEGSPAQADSSPSLRVRKARALPNHDSFNLDDNTSQEADPSNIESSNPRNAPQDKLSAKISSILSRIPAPIRLATTPLPKSAERNISQKSGASKTCETPPTRPQRSVSSTPITLVPASTKTPSQQHDTEGKLYHLIQPGRDIPIKLFIRLVGGDERVMVRVGGGWADLAEYLREYAVHHQHHGIRSVSDKKFEIKSLESSPSVPAIPSSTSAEHGGRSPSGSISGNTPNSRPRTPGVHQMTEATQPDPPEEQFEGTPTSESTKHSLTGPPSATSRQDQESSRGLGLAGPKSKQIEISPQKKAWVDGMLSQARHISYEHKKPDLTDQGDSGKGIKRVYLKGKTED